jgi:hypothetical protein
MFVVACYLCLCLLFVQYVSTVIDVEEAMWLFFMEKIFFLAWLGLRGWRKWRESLSASVRGKNSVFFGKTNFTFERCDNNMALLAT